MDGSQENGSQLLKPCFLVLERSFYVLAGIVGLLGEGMH